MSVNIKVSQSEIEYDRAMIAQWAEAVEERAARAAKTERSFIFVDVLAVVRYRTEATHLAFIAESVSLG